MIANDTYILGLIVKTSVKNVKVVIRTKPVPNKFESLLVITTSTT